jgi:cell division transport system permease protein
MALNKKLGSYPGILITISLTVALFLIGFCGWIAITSNELIKYVKQNIEIQVFLEREADSTQVKSIHDYISALKIAELENNKPKINFISKENAAEIFYKETKENYKDILGQNPFRDSYVVRLKEDLIQEENLKIIKSKIEKIAGVYEVEYAKDFLKGVIVNINKIYKVLAFIVIIFFLATVLLINNTIKLALYSQRFIIRTMQLVGATDKFIQKPFLINGLIQGLVAALISISLIAFLKFMVVNQIEGLSIIQNSKAMLTLYLLLIILGPVIGILSTYQSIARYHKMDLDRLY